ncbi:MAG: hypothetical protein HY718_16020 [Planctomycetes bacterium]|nr:hypothetical protein [Planctomycetota bacterium]
MDGERRWKAARWAMPGGAWLFAMVLHPLPVWAATVALWLFDDPPGSEVAVDSSGHGFHLALGPDAAIVEGGKFGHALNPDATPRDGLGAYRYKAEDALNPGDANWTLECWLKARADMRADNRIWGLSGVNYIDYGRGDNPVGLYIARRFLPIDGPRAWNKPTGDLKADDQYHHFAVVYDSARHELRHYFDGRRQFTAKGVWKQVVIGEPPYRDVVFPPHYPMLQIGMRDAHQQWDHHELHSHERHMKKFQGLIDEMRFSDEALYHDNFEPPGSLARPFLRVWPPMLSAVVVRGKGLTDECRMTISSNLPSIPWAIHEEAEWLSLDRSQGTLTGEGQTVVVGVSAATLEPGHYTVNLKVRAGTFDGVEVPVKLTVATDVRDVSDRKQLFIDRRFIEASHNLRLRANQPQKIKVDFPGAHYPRNIIYDEGRKVWRMYYSPFARLQHAESGDGIHWTQFGPGHIGYESERDKGRLVPLDFGTVVMYDPVDAPQRRYKAFQELNYHALDAEGQELVSLAGGKDKRSLVGVYAFYSADGLRFKTAGRVLPILPEFTTPAPYWDPNISKYVVWFRVQNAGPGVGGLTAIQGNQFFYKYGYSSEKPEGWVEAVGPENMFAAGLENLRAVGRIETDDLLKPWPVAANAEQETLYATANQVKMVFWADGWDGFADFYTDAPVIYPYAQDVYLMFPTFFRHFHPSRQPWFPRFDDANGPLETVLAVSRDGIHWDRVDRSAYVPMGRNDQEDRMRTMTGLGMVRAGNDLYQYYWYTGNLHDSVLLRDDMPPMPNRSGLIAVCQRLDGFVSAEVDYRGGWITTPPITFSGNRLYLNHQCGGQGTIFVELRDLNDEPIPGYSLADCEEISCDDVAWEVRWQGSGDLAAFRGRPLKLHFRMASAKLYAFQFKDAGPSE